MIHAETPRLILRALRRDELPRLVTLLNEWDVVRWLSVVPFPYRMKDAEEFFAEISPHDAAAIPEFFALSLKGSPDLIGGIALHKSRLPNTPVGEKEIGYWLARDHWGHGLMREAARAVIDIGFARANVDSIGATTEPANHASQKTLRAAGLRDRGLVPRDYPSLRGGDRVVRWLLTREEYDRDAAAAGAA